MTIDDQIILFFLRFGEPADNSKETPATALIRINSKRRSLALELKFYKVRDYFTCVGGETYFTFTDTFFGPNEKVRDWAIYDGYPLDVRPQANWKTITGNKIASTLLNTKRMGMLERNIFHINFTAEAGKLIEWYGYGRPPRLGAVSGPDVYLTDEQAEMTVLGAVIQAKEDAGDRIGQTLYDDFNALKKSVKKTAKAMGARLEPDPEN